MKTLSLALLALLSVPALATTNVTCERVNCVPVQPNGGNGAQALCDNFTGPFQFKLHSTGGTPLRRDADVTIGESVGEGYSFKGEYNIDAGQGYNIWAKDPEASSLQVYISPSLNGLAFMRATRGIIMYVTMDLRCRKE